MNSGPNKPRGPRPPRDGNPPSNGRDTFHKRPVGTERRDSFSRREGNPERRDSFPKREGNFESRDNFPNREGNFDRRDSFPKREGTFERRDSFPKREGGPERRDSFPRREGTPERRDSFPKREGNPERRDSFPKREGGPERRDSFPKREGSFERRDNFPKREGNFDRRDSFPKRDGSQGRPFTRPNRPDGRSQGSYNRPDAATPPRAVFDDKPKPPKATFDPVGVKQDHLKASVDATGARPEQPKATFDPAGAKGDRPGLPAGFPSARPGFGSAKPGIDRAKPGFDREKPRFDRAKPRFDRAKPGFDRAKAAPAGKKPLRPAGPDARRIALNALLDVTASGAYSTLALDDHLRKSRIDPADKRLATSIFYTALENRLKITHALKQFVERMPDWEVECVLHIAAAQLLMMDKIPDYAAVDAAAEQARALNREPYVALVNGALRSLIRARDAGEIRWPDRSDPLTYLSVMHSLPTALAARLISDYGLEEAERIIAYRPEVRTETVRPNLTRMDGAAFEAYGREHGWNMEKATAPNAWRLHRPGDLTGDPDFKAGLFTVQGEGSMLAAYALEPKSAANYLDACAAPGGKSALIAELMHETGRVQSWDVHEHRVELIQNTKKRLKLDNLRPAHRDAAIPREDLNASFDGVLIDAPCSGLGVMHDKPDIKYRVTEKDLGSLVDLQKKILDACAPYVAVGGLLVYATCTILKDENERQVREFLMRHPEYEPERSTAYLPDSLKPLSLDGMVQLQAYAWNAEGFFIARMRRVRP